MKLFLPMILISTAFSLQALAAPKCGDVDGDGHWGITDALSITYQNKKRLTSAQRSVADVNLDRKIDRADAELIIKKFTGAVNCLPCPANRNACNSRGNGRGRLPGFL